MNEQNLDLKIKHWQDQLLDLGRRNKMIAFRDTRRSTLRILTPEFEELYRRIVTEEDELTFQKAIDRDADARIYSVVTLMEKLSSPMEVTVGDIRAQGSLAETAKTLKNLRDKARLALNEQGTNILYLVFGFLQWRERGGKGDGWLRSPLILVPVTLQVPSLNGQYSLKKHEDEVVVNPTLSYLLERDYGIRLPEFDPDHDSLSRFLAEVEALVNDRGWRVISDCSMGLVSFQKITMYQDLIRNEEEIRSSPIIRAVAGLEQPSWQPQTQDADFDHDRASATELYQVLDADSSQQDAIMLSRKGMSFVMQGPPGTGKSQTITNIIAQALADGKKVLFVSEKMAALEVVYNRLADVKLGDFCLNLHSHKANKKEILAQLGNNLELQWRKVKDEELAKLTRLDLIKEQLKDYAENIHTTVNPLEMTLYEVYGAICSRAALPDVEVSHPGAAETTRDQLNRRSLQLQSLDRARQRLNPPLEENPWRGLTGSYLSPVAKRTLEARLDEALSGLDALDCCRVGRQQLTELLSVSGLDSFGELCRHSGFCRIIPGAWFDRDLRQEKDTAALCARLSEEVPVLTDRILRTRGQEYILLADTPEFAEFGKEADFFGSLRTSAPLPGASVPDPRGLLREILEKGQLLRQQRQIIGNFRQDYHLKSGLGNIHLHNLLRQLKPTAIRCNPHPGWFGADGETERLLEQLAERGANLRLRRNRILETCEESVFRLPHRDLLDRFKADYAASPLRLLSGRYREDMRRIRLVYRQVRRWIGTEEVIELLQTLRDYEEDLAVFTSLAASAEEQLGLAGGDALNRDWEDLRTRLTVFRKLREIFSAPADVLRFLSDDIWDRILTSFRLENELTGWFGAADVRNLLDATDSLLQLQDLRRRREESLGRAKERMPELFRSGEPDWQQVLAAFEHMNRMKTIFILDNTQQDLRLWLTGRLEDSGDIAGQMAVFEESRQALQEILALFGSEAGLGNLRLKELGEKLRGLKTHFAEMDCYIDYCRCLDACRDQGLEEFLLQAEGRGIPRDGLADTYLKSFYYAWFEAVSSTFPAVAGFRVHSHNENVEAFRALDAHRLPVDRMRIRERLIRDMPRKDHVSHASDEMAVLLHELGKKRNIMPLRKLFRTIPNLLLRLKPCLMMSPLSVAHFLEAQTYKFDMVIFDEASQIFPQDAIGAIFRAKQVIITGDSKQLPPTNFFAVSAGNGTQGDYDDYDEDLYDSILEEASCNLPNRSLLWHYRSRYEDLISFSNREIYRNHLITFPSSTNRLPDTGVEYIHVPEGVYDNRCNTAEARRIMELVAEHIRVHPDRSLGIIAFSEAQQAVIEEQITAFRTLNPGLEWFFNENREEAFFVKNLENVQGDERDTILFSVCYGKNPQGRMYMRFGPLGATGGERRLNVAITRAKQNIKLVGSILPEDLDLSKTESEGVRMLRDYIRFAISGSRAGNSAQTPEEDVFCRQVAAYLTSMGCTVHTHVGSSDYTVDIAVEHPVHPGRYIAGIECDGEAYRKARTVRDRDHLRTAVMERMGWNMYRVWSTEWIRNPEAEQNRLMQFVRQALLEDAGHTPEKPQTPGIEVGTEIVEPVSGGTAENPYNLPLYQEFDCRTVTAESGADPLARITLQARAVIEAEQPIHMDLLYRRLCVSFPAGKVNRKVRETVGAAINRNLARETLIEDQFIRFRDHTDIRPRMSPAGNPHRSIEHISIPEISAAMVCILRGAYGMERNVLCNEVAAVFGYERSGPKIRQRTALALEQLISRGAVCLCDGKLQLQEDSV